MKRFLLGFLVLCCTANLQAQHDPQALKILDRMTAIMGDLTSFSFTMTNCRDITSDNYEYRTYCNAHDIYIDGPTRMLVKSTGDNGSREIYYNGVEFNYYNITENNYVTLEAPATLMETLDTLHKRFDFDFPAADFFYPTLTEDLIAFCTSIEYGGTSIVNGINCNLIIASNKEMDIQIWVRRDAASLPQKLVINYKKDKEIRRYETVFTSWNLDKNLPVTMFEFEPAPDARKIAIMSKTN